MALGWGVELLESDRKQENPSSDDEDACSVWWCAHTLSPLSVEIHLKLIPFIYLMQMCLYTVGRAKHAGRIIISHLSKHAHTSMHAHTHTRRHPCCAHTLLPLKMGEFSTIEGDMFLFNAVNAVMPQIAGYCSLRDTNKTKRGEKKKSNDMLTGTTSMCFWILTPALSVGRIRPIITDWDRNHCLCIQQMEPLVAVTHSCTSASDLL